MIGWWRVSGTDVIMDEIKYGIVSTVSLSKKTNKQDSVWRSAWPIAVHVYAINKLLISF